MSPEEAFASIALAAVACDGSVTREEAALLRGTLEGRHPYGERSEESMGQLFEGLLDQLQTHGWEVLVSRAIPLLQPHQRETALAMAAHLIHADRSVSSEERRLLAEMARQMALPEGRAAQIQEAIELLHRDCLRPGR
ncbi:MAG: hypothetical protein FJ083_01730 [Cyanobacteria bacterium K_Offshore_surface_m2_239]|nr:hypothetical protein [Cyanobacteria bacterium K_Offshore_surface_m2_239]